MTGSQAKQAFDQAAALVKQGLYGQAMLVPMLPSDAKVIAERIETLRRGAKTNKEKT